MLIPVKLGESAFKQRYRYLMHAKLALDRLRESGVMPEPVTRGRIWCHDQSRCAATAQRVTVGKAFSFPKDNDGIVHQRHLATAA
jgi:hypothetical protein